MKEHQVKVHNRDVLKSDRNLPNITGGGREFMVQFIEGNDG